MVEQSRRAGLVPALIALTVAAALILLPQLTPTHVDERYTCGATAGGLRLLGVKSVDVHEATLSEPVLLRAPGDVRGGVSADPAGDIAALLRASGMAWLPQVRRRRIGHSLLSLEKESDMESERRLRACAPTCCRRFCCVSLQIVKRQEKRTQQRNGEKANERQ